MSNEAFRRGIATVLQRAGDKAEEVVRATAIKLQNGMIEKSPVLTGRFKGNWQCGIGGINTAGSDRKDTTPLGKYDSEGASLATQAVLKGWKPGQTINLTNSLSYARVLEYGRASGAPGSMQAPNGMVRLTVQEYGDYLRKVVAELK